MEDEEGGVCFKTHSRETKKPVHDVNYTVEGEMKKSVHEGKTRIRESLRSQSMTSKLESRRA